MNSISEFEDHLPQPLQTVFRSLKSPVAVQEYLDSIPYKAEELDRSPLQVMNDGQAHCLDGGIFAALALWRIGFRPLILDLVPAPGMDDDHVLAVFQVDGLWGTLAKSNYPNLRYREPVYRSLRELAMTYFEFFFSLQREKTLRDANVSAAPAIRANFLLGTFFRARSLTFTTSFLTRDLKIKGLTRKHFNEFTLNRIFQIGPSLPASTPSSATTSTEKSFKKIAEDIVESSEGVLKSFKT